MKKNNILLTLGFASIMGLSFYSAKTTKIDEKLANDNTEKTYIVEVKGDVLKDNSETLRSYRNSVINQIRFSLPDGSFEITNTYDTVLNGFSIKVNSNYASFIEKIAGVTEVNQSHQYALPETVSSPFVSTDAGNATKEQRLENYSAETMAARASDVKAVTNADSKGGQNITIGIIDTGMYINQIAGTSARTTAESKQSLNAAAFKDFDSSVEYKMTKQNVIDAGFSESYFTHFNNKIFFARDYAGSDNDVDPTAKGSEHGTHVASLAAANGDDFKGIAPNAQIAVLKVFGDNDSGAATDAIIGALNDAAKLGLDIVNLSLGSDLSTEEDSSDDSTYKAIQNAISKGVIVNYAAGNSGKSSYSSSKSYSDWTRDTVETSIIGSSAHFDESCNIVAASNPDTAFYSSIMTVQKDGDEAATAVSYSDQVKKSSTQNLQDKLLEELIPDGSDSVEKDYVVIPNYGKSADYDGLDVNGKIAVVNRGTTTFVQKYKQAENHGAIAMICINNDPSVTFNFSMDFNDNQPSIPVVFVFQNSKSIFGAAKSTGKIVIGTNSVQKASDGNTIASFSSDGGEYNLDMGVTVSAPGKEIIGAVDATAYNDNSDATNPGYSLLTGYENLSGTSMAAPNFTGALALYLGEKQPLNNGSLKVADSSAFETEKQVASMKAMSSADQLVDTTGNGTKASPRLQGAGRINVSKMLTANSYVTTENSDLGGFNNTIQAKAELKNTGGLYVQDGDFSKSGENYIEFEYTIHNDSSTSKTYTPSLSVMIPSLRVQTSHDEYIEEEENSRAEAIGYNKDVTFDENDLSTYPKGIGQATVSVNDDELTVPSANVVSGSSVTVAANSTQTATIKVRIDNLHVEKEWEDSKLANFSGTLKEYYKEYFSDAGGNYVEGYLTLTESGSDRNEDLTLPYLGFYGDYTVGEAVECFDFEREDGKLYNSELVDNYMQNLNDTYKKSNAYTGSTLSSRGSSLSSSELNQIGNMSTSAKANGTTYLSVTGDTSDEEEKNHIYAGAKGISDHLISVFFVNRSVEDANWSIETSTGSVVKKGGISRMYLYGDNYVNLNAGSNSDSESHYNLAKSWIYSSTSTSSPFAINRGYADIDLSSVDEGEYVLKYSFDLKGVNKTQVKQYDLSIDKTAPQLASLSITKDGSDQSLNVTAKGANSSISANVTLRRTPTKVSGSDDLYSTNFWLTDDMISSDKVFLQLEDYAHNQATVIVKPSQIQFAVASTFFTQKQDFAITLYSSANNIYHYSVSIFDASTGNDIKMTGDYTIIVQLATGLNPDDIEVLVEDSETETEYDATTGSLIIHMGKNATAFSINQKPVSDNNPSTSDSTSSNTSDSTSTDNGGTSNSNTKKGCGGSVIAASSSIGALALVTLAVALKKKKEDK